MIRPTGWQLGLAAELSDYGIEGSGADVSEFDLMAVVRFLNPGQGARFFLGGKAGYSTQSLENQPFETSGRGFTIGATIGVLIPMGSVDLEIAGDALRLSCDDVEFLGEELPRSESRGFRMIGRVGFSIPIGKG